MSGWSKLVDLELNDEDQLDYATSAMGVSMKPRYPWGLRITLTHKELEKLGLDCDCEIGDVVDLRAFATVTSVSANKTEGGVDARVELQIEKLSVENEASESMEDDE